MRLMHFDRRLILDTGALVAVFLLIIFLLIIYRRKNKFDLSGRHVLVTGGSSGIGKCVAAEAAKLGASVTIIARDINKLEAAVKEIQNYCVNLNQKIRYISLDISNDYEGIHATLNKLEVDFGPVFMLINCAGTAICGTLENMSLSDIHHLVNLNFLGTLHITKALVANMKQRKEGFIVITASQAALVGIYGLTVYSATKFALRGLAESLRMEVKPHKISVTLAMPPDTDTPGFENEEKSKPEATRVISKAGGLFKPEVVARQLIKDTLNAKFFSTVGFESRFVTILCSGMSPASSLFELLFESIVIGFLRFVSPCFLFNFDNIIKECEKTKCYS